MLKKLKHPHVKKSLFLSALVLIVLVATLSVVLGEINSNEKKSQKITLNLPPFSGLNWSKSADSKVAFLTNESTDKEALHISNGQRVLASTDKDNLPAAYQYYVNYFYKQGFKRLTEEIKENVLLSDFQKEDQFIEIQTYQVIPNNNKYIIDVHFGEYLQK